MSGGRRGGAGGLGGGQRRSGQKVALMHIYARARVCALPCRAAAPHASGERGQLRAGRQAAGFAFQVPPFGGS